MSVINQLSERIKSFNEQLESGALLSDIVLENEALIVDMNAENQLYESGENALGVSIADYQPYSPVTIQIKELKGQPTNRVTLRDEGDFESSFYVEVGDKAFEIKASDFKTEDLIKKYGRQIMGLNAENKAVLVWEYIYPAVVEKLRQTLNKE